MRFIPAEILPCNSFVSPAGSPVLVHHEARFNGERTVIVETGFSNIQESIDAYAPFCDINYMLSRLKIGDNSVLSRKQPLYGNFSGLPSNPCDIFNIVRSAEQSFSDLSLEEKNACNNDYRVWLSRLLSGNSGVPSTSASDPVSLDPAPAVKSNSEV